MLVRFSVKSVEPTKSFGGRKTVEGATLKAKSGLCAVVEAESVEKVMFEAAYVVPVVVVVIVTIAVVVVLLVTVVVVELVGAVVVDVELALTVVGGELVVLLIVDEVEDNTTELEVVGIALTFSALPNLLTKEYAM